MSENTRTDAQLLREAKALIEDPQRWTRHALARSKYQRAMGPEEPGAVCWCAMGAAMKVGGGDPDTSQLRLLRLLRFLALAAHEVGSEPVASINDKLGHAAVMALYGRAIELAELKEQTNMSENTEHSAPAARNDEPTAYLIERDGTRGLRWDEPKDEGGKATALYPGQGWLPVETTPPTNIDLLVCNLGYFAIASFHKDGKWYCERGVCIRPTHWMPLPKPPVAAAKEQP